MKKTNINITKLFSKIKRKLKKGKFLGLDKDLKPVYKKPTKK